MRNENKESKKQRVRSDRSGKKSSRRSGPAVGLTTRNEISRAAERKIGRTPHSKTSISGADDNGQVA
jgi:hypothetical protein